MHEVQRGRVLAIYPQEVIVEHQKQCYHCTLRGSLKKEKTQNKNLLVVGDFVEFKDHCITKICDRSSILSRQEHFTRRKQQLIAANIDQVLITLSVKEPSLKTTLIDRYLIATYKGNMEPVIVINKVDLCEDRDELFAVIQVYQNLGIPVIATSIKTQEGLDELAEQMKNVASVFSGQSGVGKSSLINAMTGLSLEVGEIRQKSQKGSHTTTNAHLVPLTCGGWCIDTPGIRSFGIWDLKREDLVNYFPEIKEVAKKCHYPDCSHTHELNCAVIPAAYKGEIPPFRFESYLKLLTETS